MTDYAKWARLDQLDVEDENTEVSVKAMEPLLLMGTPFDAHFCR